MAGVFRDKHVTIYFKAAHACDVCDDVVGWKRDAKSTDECATTSHNIFNFANT
jgi:hypothetical protein